MFDLNALSTWDKALATLPNAPEPCREAHHAERAVQDVCPVTGARAGGCPFFRGEAA